MSTPAPAYNLRWGFRQRLTDPPRRIGVLPGDGAGRGFHQEEPVWRQKMSEGISIMGKQAGILTSSGPAHVFVSN